MGCPHGAKWTSRVFVEEAVEHGAELVTGARVERVLRSNSSALGVEARVDGHRRRFVAGRVVLAAGGIGSAQILRASGIERAGHDVFFDPLVVVHGEVEDLRGGREFPMAAGVQALARRLARQLSDGRVAGAPAARGAAAECDGNLDKKICRS